MGKNYGLDIAVFGAPVGFNWGDWDGDDDDFGCALFAVFAFVIVGVLLYYFIIK